jgi:formylglycine-generating enzyme required for sulfatase activity
LDAARFCNWLQNGQPTNLGEATGSTETGAYTLNGDVTRGFETKNAGATWWIPTENEWYKAAFYDPNYGGTGIGGYWTYATQSNTAPGNVVGSGSNEANFFYYVYSVTQSSLTSNTQNYLTPVGSFSGSASYYGTYDQGGDVLQWDDSVIDDGSGRGLRGSSWSYSADSLESYERAYFDTPLDEDANVGFRVASIPEPNYALLVLSGTLALAPVRKRLRNFVGIT